MIFKNLQISKHFNNQSPRLYHNQIIELSQPIGVATIRSSKYHYRLMLSQPDPRFLTTDRCCHNQINKFSQPIGVVTTRSTNSHYRSLLYYQINEFSLPIGAWKLFRPCAGLRPSGGGSFCCSGKRQVARQAKDHPKAAYGLAHIPGAPRSERSKWLDRHTFIQL